MFLQQLLIIKQGEQNAENSILAPGTRKLWKSLDFNFFGAFFWNADCWNIAGSWPTYEKNFLNNLSIIHCDEQNAEETICLHEPKNF